MVVWRQIQTQLSFEVYNAGLTSSLTYEEFTLPVETLQRLEAMRDDFEVRHTGHSKIPAAKFNCKHLCQTMNCFCQILVMKDSVDEAYFMQATQKTNKLAFDIYKTMIEDRPAATVEDMEVAEQMMSQSNRKILFASETMVCT